MMTVKMTDWNGSKWYQPASGITFLPLVRYRHFSKWIRMREAQKVIGILINFHTSLHLQSVVCLSKTNQKSLLLIGCPRNKPKHIFGLNWNIICFNCFSLCFMKPQIFFFVSVCFHFSKMYRNNQNKILYLFRKKPKRTKKIVNRTPTGTHMGWALVGRHVHLVQHKAFVDRHAQPGAAQVF